MHRFRYNEVIKVKGSAKTDFECDLIVWQASISAKDSLIQEGYNKIQEQRNLVKSYLKETGVFFLKSKSIGAFPKTCCFNQFTVLPSDARVIQ